MYPRGDRQEGKRRGSSVTCVGWAVGFDVRKECGTKMTYQSIDPQEDDSHAVLDKTRLVSRKKRSSRLGTPILVQRRIQIMNNPMCFGRATQLMGDLTNIGIDIVDKVWASC